MKYQKDGGNGKDDKNITKQKAKNPDFLGIYIARKKHNQPHLQKKVCTQTQCDSQYLNWDVSRGPFFCTVKASAELFI